MNHAHEPPKLVLHFADGERRELICTRHEQYTPKYENEAGDVVECTSKGLTLTLHDDDDGPDRDMFPLVLTLIPCSRCQAKAAAGSK